MFIIFNISHHLSRIYTRDEPAQEVYSYISIKHATIPIYLQRIQVSLSEQNWPPQKNSSKLVNINNTNLNLKITSYFMNILAYPHVPIWYTTGGHITKGIKYLGLTKHHQRKLERTWLMFNSFEDTGVPFRIQRKTPQSTLADLSFKKFAWNQCYFRCDGKTSWTALHNPFD